MTLYIATPVNARDESTFEAKHRAAMERIQHLKEVLRHDERFAHYDKFTSGVERCPIGTPEPQAVGRCVQTVLECDAVYMDAGYEASRGCMTEHDTCRRYQIPVFGDNWSLTWED